MYTFLSCTIQYYNKVVKGSYAGGRGSISLNFIYKAVLWFCFHNQPAVLFSLNVSLNRRCSRFSQRIYARSHLVFYVTSRICKKSPDSFSYILVDYMEERQKRNISTFVRHFISRILV